MLLLVFHVGEERYGLEARRVVEVLPQSPTRKLLGVPDCVAGDLEYRGELAPVVDLCQMFLGRAASDRLSTRLIVVEYPCPGQGNLALGLLGERVTETIEVDPAELASSGIQSDFHCLGRVAAHPDGPIQFVLVEELLTPELRGRLFPEEQPA